MKLRRLEMLLEKVAGFENPSPELEQYQTPAPLAARLLYTGFMAGDIGGLRVLDLGSGTGILAIGAALLGAAEVFAVETDAAANRRAEENAENLGVSVSFIDADLRDEAGKSRIPEADTIVMNPPFGAQNLHADRPFIDTALEKGDVTYGIFNAGSEAFVRQYSAGRGDIASVIRADFTIPRTFFFHKDDQREVPVEILIFRRKQR
jgi:putative methylase